MNPVQLEFRLEWERFTGSRGRELRATWARLEIWAGDDCVSQIEDLDTRSVSRSLFCPIYPLAEWLAFNWWLLLADSRPRSTEAPEAEADWRAHHNLRTAGDGYAWPDLSISSDGESTHLLWRRDRSRPLRRSFRFIRDGQAWITTDSLRRTMANLIESVLTRLREDGCEQTPLSEEWSAITSATAAEEAFCLASASLGLDPYSLPADTARAAEDAARRLPENVLADFFDAVEPTLLREGVAWVEKGSDVISSGMAGDGAVQSVRLALSPASEHPGRLPWQVGYALAKTLRSRFGPPHTSRIDISSLLGTTPLPSPSRRLQGQGGLSPAGGAVLVLGVRMSSEPAISCRASPVAPHWTGQPVALPSHRSAYGQAEDRAGLRGGAARAGPWHRGASRRRRGGRDR